MADYDPTAAWRGTRDKARQLLDWIEKGYSSTRATGGGPIIDMTEELRAKEQAIVDQMDRMIATHEARNA